MPHILQLLNWCVYVRLSGCYLYTTRYRDSIRRDCSLKTRSHAVLSRWTTPMSSVYRHSFLCCIIKIYICSTQSPVSVHVDNQHFVWHATSALSVQVKAIRLRWLTVKSFTLGLILHDTFIRIMRIITYLLTMKLRLYIYNYIRLFKYINCSYYIKQAVTDNMS